MFFCPLGTACNYYKEQGNCKEQELMNYIVCCYILSHIRWGEKIAEEDNRSSVKVSECMMA